MAQGYGGADAAAVQIHRRDRHGSAEVLLTSTTYGACTQPWYALLLYLGWAEHPRRVIVQGTGSDIGRILALPGSTRDICEVSIAMVYGGARSDKSIASAIPKTHWAECWEL